MVAVVHFAALLCLLQVGRSETVVKLPFEVLDLSPTNIGSEVVVKTRNAIRPDTNDLRFYVANASKTRPKLVTKGSWNFIVSPNGRLLATESAGSLLVKRISDGKQFPLLRGSDLYAFSPDSTMIALREGSDYVTQFVVARIADGSIRTRKSALEIARPYLPKDATLNYVMIRDWLRQGLLVEVTYDAPLSGGRSSKFQTVFLLLDPTSGKVAGKAPEYLYSPTSVPNLVDGSTVFDELANNEASMSGSCRIVRLVKGKRSVLFQKSGISAGHEMGPGFLTSPRGMKIVVYGANIRESNRAWIWSVNPLTGQTIVLASGKYRMPKWADGNSMFVRVSKDGKWLFYCDFWDHNKVQIRKL